MEELRGYAHFLVRQSVVCNYSAVHLLKDVAELDDLFLEVMFIYAGRSAQIHLLTVSRHTSGA